ncbi:MAG TPA: FHA domain-containing protein [Gemmataceae bacterium]|nr:FHA domain-containing protein [Gemmataceae bacterium]
MKQPAFVQLVALTDGPNIPLDKPIVLIGRHQECDIQIPSRKISRRHCCIAQINDHFVVRDLGSTNGIRINGVRILEGNLEPEDELTIGNVRYQLKVGAEPDNMAHAIRAGTPVNGRRVDEQESREEPMALPDMSLSKSVPQGKPATPAKALSLPVPDKIDRVPLDPPSQ